MTAGQYEVQEFLGYDPEEGSFYFSSNEESPMLITAVISHFPQQIGYGSHFPYEKMIGRTVPVSYAEKRYKTGISQRFYDLGCVFFGCL